METINGSLLKNFFILKINEDISDIATDLIYRYSKSHNLKIPDSLIAFSAIYSDIPLFTYNKKDFAFIKSLILYK